MSLGVEDSHVSHVEMSESEAASGPLRYIVNKRTSMSVNGATVPFEAGTVLDSEPMIAKLLGARADISPVKDEEDLGTCPHCGKSFSLAAQGGARKLLARARMLMPGFR